MLFIAERISWSWMSPYSCAPLHAGARMIPPSAIVGRQHYFTGACARMESICWRPTETSASGTKEKDVHVCPVDALIVRAERSWRLWNVSMCQTIYFWAEKCTQPGFPVQHRTWRSFHQFTFLSDQIKICLAKNEMHVSLDMHWKQQQDWRPYLRTWLHWDVELCCWHSNVAHHTMVLSLHLSSLDTNCRGSFCLLMNYKLNWFAQKAHQTISEIQDLRSVRSSHAFLK